LRKMQNNESLVLLYGTPASADTADAAPDRGLEVPLIDEQNTEAETSNLEPQTGGWKSFNLDGMRFALWDMPEDPPTARIMCPGGCGSIWQVDQRTAYYYSPSGCKSEYMLCAPCKEFHPEGQNQDLFAVSICCFPFRLLGGTVIMVCDLVSIILLGVLTCCKCGTALPCSRQPVAENVLRYEVYSRSNFLGLEHDWVRRHPHAAQFHPVAQQIDRRMTEQSIEEQEEEEMLYRGCVSVAVGPSGQDSYVYAANHSSCFWRLWNLGMLLNTMYSAFTVCMTAILIAIAASKRDNSCYPNCLREKVLAGTLNDPFGIFVPLDENNNALLVNQLRVGVLGLFAFVMYQRRLFCYSRNNAIAYNPCEQLRFLAWESQHGVSCLTIKQLSFNEAGYVKSTSNIVKDFLRPLCYLNFICGFLLLLGTKKFDGGLPQLASGVYAIGAQLTQAVMNYMSSSDFFFLTPLKQPRGWRDYLKVVCIDLLLGWVFIIAETMGIFLRLGLGLLFALAYVITGAICICTCGKHPQLEHTHLDRADDDAEFLQFPSQLGAWLGSYVAAGQSTDEDQCMVNAWSKTFQSLFFLFIDLTTLTIKLFKPGHQSR
jgi:hypothetical protein